MADAPTLKSARGHVAHYERLIVQYTERRDTGDALPDAATLTRWIREAEADLKIWRGHVDKAEAAERSGA